MTTSRQGIDDEQLEELGHTGQQIFTKFDSSFACSASIFHPFVALIKVGFIRAHTQILTSARTPDVLSCVED